MRLQNLTTALRTFSIPLRRRPALLRFAGKQPLPVSRSTVLKAAPTIPFFGSFFSSSAKAESSDNMSYPDKRGEDEWRAVLSPGLSLFTHTYSDMANAYPKKKRSIPHPPPKRHRTPLHRRIRLPLPFPRNLHLRRLQYPPLHSLAQIQVRLRLARVL